jgi:hypothetical protein|tara:strand:- start:105 stop:407 length:303 start_codon:yes stop_codon:yes gene_type:complete
MKTLIIAIAVMLLTTAVYASPRIYGNDGEYLGNLNSNKYDPNSVSNPYGKHGSKYAPNSINNPYGKYGSEYSPSGVNNPYAAPPTINRPSGIPMYKGGLR